MKGSANAHASGRRRSAGDTGEPLRVHVNPNLVVIEGGSEAVQENAVSPTSFNKTINGEVTKQLASAADGQLVHHNLLLTLAALLLERKPRDPEQYLVDHMYSKELTTSQVVPNGRRCDSSPDRQKSEVEDINDNRSAAPSLSFAPVGDTVVERLVFAAPTGHCRSVLLHVAQLLMDVRPEDPEHFLLVRLQRRQFEATTNNLPAFFSDGISQPPPEDPTQIALLKEVPMNTPGYSVAASVMALLFSKKPDDPILYLFYHLSSRSRSSAAQSMRSSFKRGGDEESNCICLSNTSREVEEDDDDDDDDEEFGMSAGLAVKNFITSIQRRDLPSCSSRDGVWAQRYPTLTEECKQVSMQRAQKEAEEVAERGCAGCGRILSPLATCGSCASYIQGVASPFGKHVSISEAAMPGNSLPPSHGDIPRTNNCGTYADAEHVMQLREDLAQAQYEYDLVRLHRLRCETDRNRRELEFLERHRRLEGLDIRENSPLRADPPYRSAFFTQPCTPGPMGVAAVSDLDVLRKRIELLEMELSRAKGLEAQLARNSAGRGGGRRGTDRAV